VDGFDGVFSGCRWREGRREPWLMCEHFLGGALMEAAEERLALRRDG